MTIANMHIAVKLGLDKTSALDLPAFEPEEIDHWLNKAILKFVKTRYSGVNVKGESFEQTQKRVDDLSTLVKYTTLVLTAGTEYPNSFIVNTGVNTWPSDYLLTIAEEVGTSTSLRWGVTQCNHDEYRQKIDDPYSEHISHYGSAKPLRLFDDTNVKLIGDGTYTLSNYYLTYLREPATVDVDTPTNCDLPDHTHDEIVELTVNMMLENIEQPRMQTHGAVVATME